MLLSSMNGSVRPSVRPSVCPSVCLSVTPFWLCSHHPIIMKFSGVITSDKSDVHAKGQGQRSEVKVTEVTTQLNRFRTVTPVWIHIWWWDDAYSLIMLRRGALLFFKVILQISRSHGSKNCRIWPRLGVSGAAWSQLKTFFIENCCFCKRIEPKIICNPHLIFGLAAHLVTLTLYTALSLCHLKEMCHPDLIFWPALLFGTWEYFSHLFIHASDKFIRVVSWYENVRVISKKHRESLWRHISKIINVYQEK